MADLISIGTHLKGQWGISFSGSFWRNNFISSIACVATWESWCPYVRSWFLSLSLKNSSSLKVWEAGSDSGCSCNIRTVVRETMCHCIHLVRLSFLCLRKQEVYGDLETPCANPYPSQGRWVVVKISWFWGKKEQPVLCHWSTSKRNIKLFLEKLERGRNPQTFSLGLF